MTTTFRLAFPSLAASLVLAATAPAFGEQIDVFDTTGPEFISGDGIGIEGFVQNDAATSVPGLQQPTVSIRARDRDNANPVNFSGNRYFVDPGFSTKDPSVSNLSVDYQFDPGVDEVTNYILRLDLDFDPTVGVADFTTFTLPIFDADGVSDSTVDSWSETDGFFTTNQGGTWNDQTVPYVVSNSTRLDFNFFGNPPFNRNYDPNATGEYEFRLTVFDGTGLVELANATAFAVIPEPASLTLLGLGTLALLGRRRRA